MACTSETLLLERVISILNVTIVVLKFTSSGFIYVQIGKSRSCEGQGRARHSGRSSACKLSASVGSTCNSDCRSAASLGAATASGGSARGSEQSHGAELCGYQSVGKTRCDRANEQCNYTTWSFFSFRASGVPDAPILLSGWEKAIRAETKDSAPNIVSVARPRAFATINVHNLPCSPRAMAGANPLLARSGPQGRPQRVWCVEGQWQSLMNKPCRS